MVTKLFAHPLGPLDLNLAGFHRKAKLVRANDTTNSAPMQPAKIIYFNQVVEKQKIHLKITMLSR